MTAETRQVEKPRYNLRGHQVRCTGHLSLSIKHENKKYRIVRSCECGAVYQPGLLLFDNHAEAWKVFQAIEVS